MSKGGKDSPCLSLLPLGPRFMAFSPLSGNKRAIWRRKDFISIPSYLTSSWAVVSSSFCWAVWGCTQEEEEARGHSVLMALRLWEKLWIGLRMTRHEESLKILQQFSHPGQPRHSPVARIPGIKYSQWEVMTAKKQADLIHRALQRTTPCGSPQTV